MARNNDNLCSRTTLVPNWKERGGYKSGKRIYRDSAFWHPLTEELEKLVEEDLQAQIEQCKKKGDTCKELELRGKLRNAEDELAWRRGDDGRRARKRNLRDWFGKEYEGALKKYGVMGNATADKFLKTLYRLYTDKKYASFPMDSEDVHSIVLESRILPELWQVRWKISLPGEEDREFAVRYRNRTNRFEEFYQMIGGCDMDGVAFSEISEGDTVAEWVIEHPNRPKELIAIEQKEIAEEVAKQNSPECIANQEAENAKMAEDAWNLVRQVLDDTRKAKGRNFVVPVTNKMFGYFSTGLARSKFFNFNEKNLRLALSAKSMEFVDDKVVRNAGQIVDEVGMASAFVETFASITNSECDDNDGLRFNVKSVRLRAGGILYLPGKLPHGVIPEKIVVDLSSQW